MSADPITMFAITATKTLMDIKESKKQSKIEQRQYEEKKKAAAERAKQEEDDRINDLRMAHAHNRAIMAGTGFSLDSRSFLAINQDVQDKAEKDIANIRVNLGYDINELSLNQQAAKSKRKHEVFGGWASIASQTYEYKNKKGLYQA